MLISLEDYRGALGAVVQVLVEELDVRGGASILFLAAEPDLLHEGAGCWACRDYFD